MTGSRPQGLFRLFRFELPFAAGVCVVLGQFLALDATPQVPHMVLGFPSFFFISAAALILNDYFDLTIDRVNASHRPLPAGIVTQRACGSRGVYRPPAGSLTGCMPEQRGEATYPRLSDRGRNAARA